MPVVYRPARAPDLARADELVVASINDLTERHGFGAIAVSRPTKFQLFSLQDDAGGLWVAEDAGDIVGFAWSWACDDLWFLAQLFVSPGRQGSGIGNELLKRTFEHAEKSEAATQGSDHLQLQYRVAGTLYPARTIPPVSDLQFQRSA